MLIFFLFADSLWWEYRSAFQWRGSIGRLSCSRSDLWQDLVWQVGGLSTNKPPDINTNRSFGNGGGNLSLSLSPLSLGPSHVLPGVRHLWWVLLCDGRTSHPWNRRPGNDGQSCGDHVWCCLHSYDNWTSLGRYMSSYTENPHLFLSGWEISYSLPDDLELFPNLSELQRVLINPCRILPVHHSLDSFIETSLFMFKLKQEFGNQPFPPHFYL